MKLINLNGFKKSLNLIGIYCNTNIAHLSTNTPHVTPPIKSGTIDSEKWHAIYKLPTISIFAGLSRLKLYQAAGTAIIVPVSMGLESLDMFPNGLAELFGLIGITGTLTLCLYSAISKNIIGFIYTTTNCQSIRLAYVDFWGRRKNADFNVNDLDYKLSDRSGYYLRIKTKIGTFKLLPQFGQILNGHQFSNLFGD